MLDIENLSRNYGAFRALNGLNLHVGAGQLHGFVGPNGAGKTTTMRILATLLPASGGRALIDGTDVSREPRKVRRKVGYMPDFFGVYDRLKASEYLDFYARCYAFPAKARARMIDSLLAVVRLSDKKDAYVDELSRGMKQRLCLARALIHDPKLLLLDEPASGMDPRARAEMKSILRSLKDMGKTVLISSHILPELSEMCDSLTIIDHGSLVFSGPVEELADRMKGNAPLTVRLTPDAGEDARRALLEGLRQFPGVEGIIADEPELLRVRFSGGEDAACALLRSLVTRDLPVMDFHRAKMDLEKVFMEVTQDD